MIMTFSEGGHASRLGCLELTLVDFLKGLDKSLWFFFLLLLDVYR